MSYDDPVTGQVLKLTKHNPSSSEYEEYFGQDIVDMQEVDAR